MIGPAQILARLRLDGVNEELARDKPRRTILGQLLSGIKEQLKTRALESAPAIVDAVLNNRPDPINGLHHRGRPPAAPLTLPHSGPID